MSRTEVVVDWFEWGFPAEGPRFNDVSLVGATSGLEHPAGWVARRTWLMEGAPSATVLKHAGASGVLQLRERMLGEVRVFVLGHHAMHETSGRSWERRVWFVWSRGLSGSGGDGSVMLGDEVGSVAKVLLQHAGDASRNAEPIPIRVDSIVAAEVAWQSASVGQTSDRSLPRVLAAAVLQCSAAQGGPSDVDCLVGLRQGSSMRGPAAQVVVFELAAAGRPAKPMPVALRPPADPASAPPVPVPAPAEPLSIGWIPAVAWALLLLSVVGVDVHLSSQLTSDARPDRCGSQRSTNLPAVSGMPSSVRAVLLHDGDVVASHDLWECPERWVALPVSVRGGDSLEATRRAEQAVAGLTGGAPIQVVPGVVVQARGAWTGAVAILVPESDVVPALFAAGVRGTAKEGR